MYSTSFNFLAPKLIVLPCLAHTQISTLTFHTKSTSLTFHTKTNTWIKKVLAWIFQDSTVQPSLSQPGVFRSVVHIMAMDAILLLSAQYGNY